MEPLRLSDADREAAVHQLGEQYAVGRLTKDEFDERRDAVWSARTRGDLAPVFADLPVQKAGQPARSARTATRGPRRGWPFPLAPVLFVLIALTVLTHLPIVVLVLVIFFVAGRFRHGGCGGHRQPR